MKRVLYLAVIYLLTCLVGTLIFATLFMLSCNLTMFVTGLPTSFFSSKFFFSGVLTTFPLACVITQIMLVLYQVRHPGSKRISLIMYAFFGILSWLLLIPIDLKLINRYEADLFEPRLEKTTSGVFRKEEHGVFYYSRVSDDGIADGLFIDTTGFLGTEGVIVPFFNVPVKNESAFPYSDILIKNSLQPPKLVTYPLAVYAALLTAGGYSVSLGFLSWLAFASLGLALLTGYGLQYASSWKLASVSCVLTAVIVIAFINYLYYMNILPSVFKEISQKLSDLTPVKDPLIVLVNCSIAIILCGFGIFMGIYRQKNDTILEANE